MQEVAAAFLASLTCVAAFALVGIAPFRDEFQTVARRLLGLVLWVGVLALVVFLPVATASPSHQPDPEEIGFYWVFAGHVLLVVFLFAWWRLRGDLALADFLALRRGGAWPGYALAGFAGGLLAWAVTVTVTGLLAGTWAHVQQVEVRAEIPPVVYWMANLPAWKKLLVVLVAMTVEEAFFRAFLQRRIGLWISSVLFALSHFSYGQPFLVVGVFVVSLFFGWLFARTGSLVPPMIAHGLFNGIQLFVVLPALVRLVAES